MDSRPFVLQLVRKADHSYSLEEPKTAKKRKRNPSRASSADTTISGPSRFPSSPTTVNTSPSRQKKTKYIDMTIPSSDADEEEISIPNRSFVPKGRFLWNYLTLKQLTFLLYRLVGDFVRCPICEIKVKYIKLNEHIDNGCKDPSSSDAAVKTWSKIMTGSKKGKHKYVSVSL